MKIGTTELLIILAVVILIFGPTQLPKLFKLFGKSVKSLRKGMDEMKEEIDDKEEDSRPARKEEKAEDSRPVKTDEEGPADKTGSDAE